jgi:hypothetical protein
MLLQECLPVNNSVDQLLASETSQVPVAHACNPTYSGGSDQEDCSSKPSWANSLKDPISKIPNTKRAGGVAQGVGPEFKLQYHKKKKRRRRRKEKNLTNL